MKSKAAIRRILTTLDTLYPWDGRCFLEYEMPWQLLFATILSAQCTDERVNQVTPGLFAQFPTLGDFASTDIAKLEEAIRSTGFFRMKARHLQQCARDMISYHDGTLPSDIDVLTKLPGVGRKTANVVRGHIFGIPSVTVDTHVGRCARRLGLTAYTDAVKIEFELMRILPKKNWIRINQQLITLGREICKARNPRCAGCPLYSDCARNGVN